MNFRNPTIEDAEEISKLFFERMTELNTGFTYEQSVEIMKSEANKIDFNYSFVAEENGKIKGYVFIGLSQFAFKETPFIYYFFITNSIRKQGIGEKLLKYVFDVLKKEGFENVQLACLIDNKPTLKLYDKFGFKKTKYLLKKQL